MSSRPWQAATLKGQINGVLMKQFSTDVLRDFETGPAVTNASTSVRIIPQQVIGVYTDGVLYTPVAVVPGSARKRLER